MLKNFNKPIINKREWQSMTQYPYSASAAVCIIAPEDAYCDHALVVGSATTAAIYDYNNDGYELATNPALAGTFGAGTCGVYSPWGIPYITAGGSGNTLTVNSVAFNITGLIIGTTLVITSGTQVGFTTTVTGVLTDGGNGMITIYLKDALPAAVASGDTFKTLSGSYYVVNGGTKAANNFKAFDLGTRNWTVGLDNTALPNLTADAAMTTMYKRDEYMAEGKASGGTSTTMISGRTTTTEADQAGLTAPNWTANQWKGYQVTITKGLFRQTRVITANTSVELTVSPAFTFTPDNTCTYKIESDEDSIYLIGNAAITLYKYSISKNLWTVLAPTVARAGVPGGGTTLDSPTNTKRFEWSYENNIRNGRYLYSLRGGGTTLIDRYDIVANKWEVVNTKTMETFTSGTSSVMVHGNWYIKSSASGYRLFRYNVVDNVMYPFSTIAISEGGVVAGQKIHAKRIKDTDLIFLYSIASSQTAVYRTLLY